MNSLKKISYKYCFRSFRKENHDTLPSITLQLSFSYLCETNMANKNCEFVYKTIWQFAIWWLKLSTNKEIHSKFTKSCIFSSFYHCYLHWIRTQYVIVQFCRQPPNFNWVTSYDSELAVPQLLCNDFCLFFNLINSNGLS